jgi:hypothetical protein
MGLLLIPIVDGKIDANKQFVGEMVYGSRSEAFNDLNKRYQLTRHDVWMRERVSEFHSMNFDEPPPEPAQKLT